MGFTWWMKPSKVLNGNHNYIFQSLRTDYSSIVLQYFELVGDEVFFVVCVYGFFYFFHFARVGDGQFAQRA